MTPGILALIAAVVFIVGILVMILNFTSFLRQTEVKVRNFVWHVIAGLLISFGAGGLIFSGLWFLVGQIGKG